MKKNNVLCIGLLAVCVSALIVAGSGVVCKALNLIKAAESRD